MLSSTNTQFPYTVSKMPLESDLTLKAATFDPAGYSEQSAKFNEYLMQIGKAAPKWWEVGAPAYREMRRKGGTALPGRKMLPEGIDIKIPSRENGREIPGRLMYPSSRSSEDERKKCNGVVIHIHGGGWVLGDEMSTDKLLLHYANTGDLAVISVGYRLAPEDPFPAAPEDCQDVAEYLVQNAESQYGGPLKFIGGERYVQTDMSQLLKYKRSLIPAILQRRRSLVSSNHVPSSQDQARLQTYWPFASLRSLRFV